MAQAATTHRADRRPHPSAVLEQSTGARTADDPGPREMDTLVRLLDQAITRRVSRDAGSAET